MEQLRVMNDFFSAIAADPRISSTHIAIFTGIFQYWSKNGLELPVKAFSHQIMPLAKLNSRNVYVKRLKELDEYGYIRYEPSFKRDKGSRIYLL